MGSNEPVNDNNLSSSDRRILSSSEVIEIYCDLLFVNKAPKHFYLCFSCEFQKECLV